MKKKKIGISIAVAVLGLIVLAIVGKYAHYKIASTRPQWLYPVEEKVELDLKAYDDLAYVSVYIPYRGWPLSYDCDGKDAEKVEWLLDSFSGTYVYDHYEFVNYKYKKMEVSGDDSFIYISLYNAEDVLLEKLCFRDYQGNDTYRDNETIYYTVKPVNWLYYHYSPENGIDWDTFTRYFDRQYKGS